MIHITSHITTRRKLNEVNQTLEDLGFLNLTFKLKEKEMYLQAAQQALDKTDQFKIQPRKNILPEAQEHMIIMIQEMPTHTRASWNHLDKMTS